MTLNSNDWKTRVPFIQYILCRGQRCRKARKYPTPKRYLQVLGLTNHGSDVLHSKKRVVGYAGPCNVVFFQSTASSPETCDGRILNCFSFFGRFTVARCPLFAVVDENFNNVDWNMRCWDNCSALLRTCPHVLQYFCRRQQYGRDMPVWHLIIQKIFTKILSPGTEKY